MGSQLKLFLGEQLCDDNVGSVKVMELYENLRSGAEELGVREDFRGFVRTKGIKMTAFWETDYPKRFNKLNRRKPAILFCRGNY